MSGPETAATPPQFATRRRVADAVRTIAVTTVASVLDDEDLEAAAVALEEVAGRMTARSGGKRPRPQPDPHRPPQEFFPTSPVMGLLNPVAPPVLVRTVDGRDGGPREIRAEAYFDWQYEGPPTCVHGGVIAEVFDEMLGAANMVADAPAMTGTLTVRYRKPTPLRADLTIEARCIGREGRNGRKVRTWAGMYHGDVLTAEAEGIFVEVDPGRFLRIAEDNVGTADPSILEAIREEAGRSGAAADVPGPAPGS